ncbi:MAG: alpha-ketoacid dehydrogenase subunit beta [Chloroflexi bacterium]|nr:alpha-ketoacid dehydrogenase subunit beta [Chloroflexota bacterium]
MRRMTYRQAVTEAIAAEMRRDDSVVFFGEDVAKPGGVFKVTPGIYEEFGPVRVRDTPISEQAIIGTALGAAITGLRPIAELMFADFIPVAMDQIVNQVAKYRFMSGGQFTVPLTIRASQGGGGGFGTQHSQCAESWLMNFPGLKLAVPATPADMYGLLRAAIRDDDPVIVLEHKSLYNLVGDVDLEAAPGELGKAEIVRPGQDLTLVATQQMLHRALEAAESLAEDGISPEVIDLRTLVPLDGETILRSVQGTSRLLIVEEAPRLGGWGANVAALVADEGLFHLDAPIKRVNMENALIAYSPALEDEIIPNARKIEEAVRQLLSET